ncbi:carbohydrate kinase family protein [Streptomyces sp. NPDC055709]
MAPPTRTSVQRITVLGECVADAFTRTSCDPQQGPYGLTLRVLPGGGPANTAVALARLGTPTSFLGRLSHDIFGHMFRTRLTQAGVDMSTCVSAPESSTLAVADLAPDGAATYTFFAAGTADWQWSPSELAAASLAGSTCLHTGSLALIQRPGGPCIEEYLATVRLHTTISLDPNVRPLLIEPSVYRERLNRWCELADIFRLSEEDLTLLLPGVSQEQACDMLHSAGATLVVITLGERGALISLHGRRAIVTTPAVDVIDTVGAGDSFTAGLLHHLAKIGQLGGRLNALTMQETIDACSYAARVAAHTCAVPGANPPWADQLREP